MHAGAKPELFRFAEKLRANMTEAEINLWGFLRLKPEGFKFRRQHPFGRYILDFYCHKVKLAIEIDGKYHDIPVQKELDEIRTIEIENLGVKEIRFTNEEVINQFEMVVHSIRRHLT
jgi:very-short-patch-repair endonuclease